MEQLTRNDLKPRPFRTRRFAARAVGVAVVSAAISLGASPVAVAADHRDGYKSGAGWTPPVEIESGAIAGANGPTLGVGGPGSYTGGSTSNYLCHSRCGSATLGVGGSSSYTGGATVNSPGGTATLGVGDVNSYTGGGIPGTTNNGTNATDRTGNYGPGW